MSFVFRGARGDIENGFPGFMPARRALRVHAARPSNSNSLTFLVTALASAWCFFDGYNAKDVCDMSTASSPGPSSCSSSQWPSWPHRTTVAYASIDSTCKPRASVGSQTSAGTS
ncbi:hypothetical protein KIW84_035408 [Lathyrus oleraceus]|uniref:Uncharacterized protein n=1 Tax=Pisum sativum TaxID=3888 RepID=A0A9D5B2C8_PEA|nr:hypothetical protein KIW84_035408 [Pisum sativum]